MTEAVIVAVSRTPIGRAMKGSLRAIRPDDLAAFAVRDVLSKVPELDPESIDDLLMGCGMPGGEQGMNIARIVAVALGYDRLPGTTVNRYCSSSLQTTRMAFHAIKAGEGDVFISAGVESVSSAARGSSDYIPGEDLRNPLFPTFEDPAGVWVDPRSRGDLPDPYISMGETAENVAGLLGISRHEQDEFAALSQNRAEQAIRDGFWQREITPFTLPDGTVVSVDDGPRAGVTVETLSGLKPVFRQEGTVTAGNACPLNDGAAALVIMSDSRAAQLGITPLARIVSTGVTGLSPEIMGLGPVEAVEAGPRPRRHDHRRHRPRRDQRGIRRAGDPVGPRARRLARQAQRARRGDRRRAPVRHDRRPHHRNAAERAADARRHLRPRDDVRRRRPGDGDGGRAALVEHCTSTLADTNTKGTTMTDQDSVSAQHELF